MKLPFRYSVSKDIFRKLTTLACAIMLPPFAYGAGPETALESLSVPEGFTVELAAGPELTSYPMFMAFDDEGRLFVAESTGKDLSGQEMAAAPECTILRLEDLDGDGVFDKRTVYADRLSLPMGLLWRQGGLYVASPPDLLRFDDFDGDGVADRREVLLTGWKIRNTASLHGPFLGPDGRLYLTHGRHGYEIETKEGEVLQGLAARIWRCRLDGSELERFAGGGFDNPVELIFTGAGEMLGTMTYYTNPRYGQRDALLHFIYGGVYPKKHDAIDEFVRTGDLMPAMTRFARLAPAGLSRYRNTAFGQAYKGNLFSAQFNPHRVQRHKLIRDGATFRTEDEDFLTSSSPDFYPTDVLEDADGSLLVCDTGAWYVDACPISRVAKPEIRGSIYRVRRAGAPETDDPWGKKIDWAAESFDGLAGLLAGPRPKVRDRSLIQIISRGQAAAAPLGALLQDSASEEACLAAVSALWQLGGEDRMPPLRAALKNKFMAVRIAAAQALGDLKDTGGLDSLINLLATAQPAGRREAATALGRLGNPIATVALLEACETAADRFVEHALIYSIIEIGNGLPLQDALKDARPNVRKAALIALDQMGAAPLGPEVLADFLLDDNAELRRTGLWVASRHPELAPDVLKYVRGWLFEGRMEQEDSDAIRDVLLAYVQEEACQTLLAELLGGPAAGPELRLFALDTMDRAPLADFPGPWRTAVGKQLDSSDPVLRWRALEVVRARDIGGFDGRLAAVVHDALEPDAFRMAALGALIDSEPMLREQRLRLVLDNLDPAKGPTLRQAAAKLIARGELTLAAKIGLAEEMLPAGDALVMTALIDVFQGETDESLGLKVVAGLRSNPRVAGVLALARVDKLFESFPPPVRRAAEPLKAQAVRRDQALVRRFRELEPLLDSGDVGLGRRIFFGDKAACSTCHAVGEEGGDLGTDLTSIGLVRSGHDLLEAILFPSASFVQDYEPYRVETEDEVFMGVLGRQFPEAIILKTGVGEEKYLARESIVSMTLSDVSVMPDGLDSGLTDEELVNLVSFLRSLNNERWLLPQRWEAGAPR